MLRSPSKGSRNVGLQGSSGDLDLPPMNLQDRVALVTGAAQRIGRAIALELAREGAGVVVHFGRSEEAARDTAKEIRALGVPCWLAQADLRQADAIDRLFEVLRTEVPRLDVLVNSAATFRSKPFLDITAEEWDTAMAVNLRAPFLLTQRAAAWMRESPRPDDESGLVVNLVDLAGVQAWCGFAHHGVSKAGLLHLTRLTARELAPQVRANAILPGAILPPPGMDEDSEEWQALLRRVPLRRAGSPESVARTVVHLAGNEFLNGAVIHLDGGERWTTVRDVEAPEDDEEAKEASR